MRAIATAKLNCFVIWRNICLVALSVLVLGVTQRGWCTDTTEESPRKRKVHASATYASCPEGTRLYFTVEREQVVATPSWMPQSGNPPPVSLKEAVDIASSELPHYLKNAAAYSLERIELHNWGADKWVYVVAFSRPSAKIDHEAPSPSRPTGRIDLVILFSGKAVEGKTSTD